MIGSLIGAAASIGSSIFGGIKASAARRKAKRELNSQLADNEDWYNRRYNEDATQRADAHRLLQRVEDAIRKRNQRAAGTAAVMGGTDESTAAAQAANNAAMTDAVSSIAASNDRRKDSIESQYNNRKAVLRGQKAAYNEQTANNITSEIGNVAQAAGSIIDNIKGAEESKEDARRKAIADLKFTPDLNIQ